MTAPTTQTLVQRADPHLAAIRAVGKGLLTSAGCDRLGQILHPLGDLSHEIEEARFGLYKAMANADAPRHFSLEVKAAIVKTEGPETKAGWLRGACGWVNALEALAYRVPVERGQENIRAAIQGVKEVLLAVADLRGPVSP